jgi:hypothetical protein
MHSNNALYQSTARYVLTTLIVDIRNFAQYALSPPPLCTIQQMLEDTEELSGLQLTP